MTPDSLATRVRRYLTTMLPQAHGHQHKALAFGVTLVTLVQSGCQAALARGSDNFAAASKRLARLLHNERLDPEVLARAQAQAVLARLPAAGRWRISLDWTTEGCFRLLVLSVQVGRRAVPLYWAAYPQSALKERMTGYERELVRRFMCQVAVGAERRRWLVTAARGFAKVELRDELAGLGVDYVVRVKASHKVELGGRWVRLGRVRWERNRRYRGLGRVRYCAAKPRLLYVCQTRARDKRGGWGVWHLVSNVDWGARRMSREYGCRFSCEEGFRDEKSLLGFKEARVKEVGAWQRLFCLMAVALLLLAVMGGYLLGPEERERWLRLVRGRRRGRSELSLVRAVAELLKKGIKLWSILNEGEKLNLQAAL